MLDYKNLTTQQVREHINTRYGTADAKASVILGLTNRNRVSADHYNLKGIAHEVAREANTFSTTPTDCMTRQELQAYEEHCQHALDEAINRHFNG